MDSMMKAMVRSIPKAKREALMLAMMPEMMRQADPNALMSNMAAEMGRHITLFGLFTLIVRVRQDPLLTEKIGSGLTAVHAAMPQMMPIMIPLMKKMIPAAMDAMMPMMSGMVMTQKHECIMADAVEHDPKLRAMMGEMMFAMCPHMAGKVIPDAKAAAFVAMMRRKVLTDRGLPPREGDDDGRDGDDGQRDQPAKT